jgi:hypothetical protein
MAIIKPPMLREWLEIKEEGCSDGYPRVLS